MTAAASPIWTDEFKETASPTRAAYQNERDDDHRWVEVYERLQSIASLTDNWDREGALAPTIRAIAAAKRVLERYYRLDLEPPSRIVPTPMGAISIEWESETEYLEAEVDVSGIIAWLLESDDGSFQQWNEVVFLEDIGGPVTPAMPIAISDEATTTSM